MRRYIIMDVIIENEFQSTHPLRDATFYLLNHLSKHSVFQSTHPLRDATSDYDAVCAENKISIHAPLTGCD